MKQHKMMKSVVAGTALAAVGLAAAPQADAVTSVGMELALVVDVSGSISDTEYNLQREGYARAFEDAMVQSFIANTPGGVAVAMIQFATNAVKVIDWTLLTNAADADNFAAAIRAEGRDGTIGNRTDIQDGMDLAIDEIEGNDYDGEKLVIDVSGDGEQNEPGDPTDPRDEAEGKGIKVNGLAIIDDFANLVTYYENNVQTSDGFVIEAENFASFDKAVQEKLRREIGGEIPEPSRAIFSLLGLLGAVMTRRRPRK